MALGLERGAWIASEWQSTTKADDASIWDVVSLDIIDVLGRDALLARRRVSRSRVPIGGLRGTSLVRVPSAACRGRIARSRGDASRPRIVRGVSRTYCAELRRVADVLRGVAATILVRVSSAACRRRIARGCGALSAARYPRRASAAEIGRDCERAQVVPREEDSAWFRGTVAVALSATDVDWIDATAGRRAANGLHDASM